MPNKKQLSPYYFIFFVVITALAAAWFFSSSNNTENTNVNNINSNNINAVKPVKINENANISVNINNNTNINAENAIGGSEEPKVSTDSLGIEVSGYSTHKTTSSDITNLNLGNENNISIMPQNYEGIVKSSISIKNQENITISGISGIKYTGASAKDGSTISFILVKKNEKLYYFKGNEDFLSNLNNIINWK